MRSLNSPASDSASLRISGTTAPSSMAARSDSSASSGRTSMAGGGRRPMRWSAARISPITSRRLSSDLRIEASVVGELRQPALGGRDPAFGGANARGAVDQRLIELAAVLAQRRDLVLQLLLAVERLLLLGADRLELLIVLADVLEAGLLASATSRGRPHANAEAAANRSRRPTDGREAAVIWCG